ncbi:hypothetical protein COB11_08690 [Candidatus Aerophobetes bacterium]|uniref:Uncharacterized protein n=1 Tax=Aerophobetes bacterium TaxID=2030807 RepID=A0A2A4Y808_UNCAE|nr:MAG: hypothetical protein COB11_08690 [Candidatus Aerophobetes bacterium]
MVIFKIISIFTGGQKKLELVAVGSVILKKPAILKNTFVILLGINKQSILLVDHKKGAILVFSRRA